MPLAHHPCIGGTDAARAQNADGLAVHAVAHKEVGEPASELASPHHRVSLWDTAGGSEGEGNGHFGGCLGEDTGGVANENAVLGGGGDDDVVEADGVVGVSHAADLLELGEEVVVPLLGELADDAVGLDTVEGGKEAGFRHNGVRLADVNLKSRGCEGLEPRDAGQRLGHHAAVGAPSVLHSPLELRHRRLNRAVFGWETLCLDGGHGLCNAVQCDVDILKRVRAAQANVALAVDAEAATVEDRDALFL
mmetsp:Transcript_43797/g.95040  ORF Transcript_43797/g.95040 Transcript_43797/m.95040 type:complete len:249 (-) Transcript_43797:11-757(-)